MSHAGHDLPTDPYMAKVYWMFVGGSIAFASAIHVADRLLYHQRLSAASKALLNPARPRNPLLRWYATATAITREATYYTAPFIPSLQKRYPRLATLPPFGKILLVTANLALLLSLASYGFQPTNRRHWEPMGVRAGWITLTQLPLIFLLAGKRSLLGYVTGVSYERLNWIHRWVARTMFLTASVHLGNFLRTWDQYSYVERKFEIDLISRRGLGAWCVLLWIVLSSFAPIRGWRYEFFVVQHIVSAVGFVSMVMLHTPTKAHQYVWVPVAIFFLDRLIRLVFMVYNNLGLFHGKPSQLLSCKATFYPLSEHTTKVTITNPPFRWSPGQHAFLSCHSIIPLQSHPFTITTLPSDNSLEFIIRAQEGATRKLFSHATETLPPLSDAAKTVIIDGPYGCIRPLEQFDTVVLLAGGTGVTFVMPLMRDLIRRKQARQPTVTRKVRFVWVVKGRGQVGWFTREFVDAVNSVAGMKDFALETSIYVTCDETLTTDKAPDYEEKQKPQPESGKEVVGLSETELCGGDVCCCQETLEDEDAIVPSDAEKSKAKCCCCGPREEEGKKDINKNSSATTLCLPDEVHIMAGRPAVKSITQKELERALGETAVVVCGPTGLIDSSRMAVVELSDERAVHKGTGAQGIWFHAEAFSM
ncbi:FAD-binding domain-containing protein [Morchella snyderi]|nr:FAD-binding domain-containing protein [Morchella snyderi]